MLTSVWREILDDSISGDKLAGGTVNPPFDLVYVKRMFLGNPAHSYPIIYMNDEDSATFGLGWNYGYGKIVNYMYKAEVIESPIPADAAPFLKIKGRSGSLRMVEMTMDKITRCGIIYAATAGYVRFQIYPSGTSYMMDKFVFGSTSFDNNHPTFLFQVATNSLLRGDVTIFGLAYITNQLIVTGEISGGTIPGNGTITGSLVPTYDWYMALNAVGWYGGAPTGVTAEEVAQIKAIDNNDLDWPNLATVDQPMSYVDVVAFAAVKSEYQNSSGNVVLGRWYNVAFGLASTITLDGIGINVVHDGLSFGISNTSAQWCWMGDGTITIKGSALVAITGGDAQSFSLRMMGTFDWASPDSSVSAYSLATWKIGATANDLTVLRSYVSGIYIEFQKLVSPTVNDCNGRIDFSVTYKVNGPIV